MSAHPIKDLFSYIGSSFIVGVIGLIAAPLITWIIIPEELGFSGIFITMAVFVSALGPFGLDQSYMRYFQFGSRGAHDSLWPSITLRSLFQTSAPIIAAVIIERYFHRFGNSVLSDYRLVILFCALCYLLVLERFLLLRLRMLQYAKGYSRVLVAKGLTNSILAVFFCWLHPSFTSLVFAQMAGSICAVFISMYFIGWNIWSAMSLKKAFGGLSISKEIIRFAAPFGLTVFLTLITEQSDRFFIRELIGIDKLGIYMLALRTVSALAIITSSFQIFWTPISYKVGLHDADANTFYNDALKAFIAIAIPIVGAFCVSVQLIQYVLGPLFREAVYIAPILALVPAFMACSEIFASGINLAKKSQYHIPITLISSGTFVCSAWPLGHLWGIRGIAIALAVASFAFLVARMGFSRKASYLTINIRKYKAPLAILLAIIVFQTLNFPWIGAGIYILILIPLLYFYYGSFYKDAFKKLWRAKSLQNSPSIYGPIDQLNK